MAPAAPGWAEAPGAPGGGPIAHEVHAEGSRALIPIDGHAFEDAIWTRVLPHLPDGWAAHGCDLRDFRPGPRRRPPRAGGGAGAVERAVGGPAPLGMSQGFRARIGALGEKAGLRAAFEAGTPAYFMPGNLGDGDRDALLAMNVAADAEALGASFEHLLTAEAMAPEAWARVDMAVLVVASTHDIVPFGAAVGLLDSLPEAVIVRSRHTPMWERP